MEGVAAIVNFYLSWNMVLSRSIFGSRLRYGFLSMNSLDKTVTVSHSSPAPTPSLHRIRHLI